MAEVKSGFRYSIQKPVFQRIVGYLYMVDTNGPRQGIGSFGCAGILRSRGSSMGRIGQKNVVSLSQIDGPDRHLLRTQIDGGLFDAPGRLDIFNCFRRPDEASMAGGVFIVVECKDKKSWQVLKAKGHPCSRNDRYAALYHPAHLLGVETGTSVLAAALMKHATGGGNLRPLCDLCGRAVRDLPKGTVLDMGGHPHTIDGVEGVLNPAAAIGPDAALPFYLLSHRTLCRDVPAGKLITLGDLDMPEESTLLRLRREQDKAFGLVK